MAAWLVIGSQRKGEVEEPRFRSFDGKSSMFETMRAELGIDGWFDCTDGRASYRYVITEHGYNRTGEVPSERQRDGRKR